MIVFELTMTGVGSWNHKWTGENKKYLRTRRESEVPKERWNRNYEYSWDDGWTACVSVRKVDYREVRKMMKNSAGFYGYDWMISSIIRYGYITTKDLSA